MTYTSSIDPGNEKEKKYITLYFSMLQILWRSISCNQVLHLFSEPYIYLILTLLDAFNLMLELELILRSVGALHFSIAI